MSYSPPSTSESQPQSQSQPSAQPQQYAPHPSMQRDPSMQAGAPLPAGERSRGRKLALIAIIFAALAALVGPIQSIFVAVVVRSDMAPAMLSLIGGVAVVVSGALSLVALGLGIASLLRGERARALAGAAIGIGAVGIIGVLSAGLQTIAYSAIF